MCGIAGFLLGSNCTAPGDAEDILRAMGTALVHRGPDAADHLWDPARGLGLAHRRLSIQDLSPSGAQPMSSASGRFTLVFNGEIYNFRSLRQELLSHDYPFRGHSDTEVMLAACEAWGVRSALERFAGMFAFALLDRETGELWLARDRMGEKPLYYGWHRGQFLFGSELKALRAYPAFSPEINRSALPLLLRHNYIPAPHTIFEGIHKLPPAHLLCLDIGDRDARPTPERYWELDDCFETASGLTAETAADRLEEVLSDVIGEQMIADVPLGAFLSGGIDSSTVVALMQKQASQPVRTFTIGFDSREFNEAEHAAAVADHLGTEHTELYVTAKDALDVIPRIPAIYDEPFADSSQIPTFLISQMTRQHVTVALSGDGGDELLAGYTRYPNTLNAWRRQHLQPGLRQRLEQVLLNLPHPLAGPIVRTLNAGQRNVSPEALAEKIQRERSLRSAADLTGFYRQHISYWSHPEQLVLGASEPAYALNTALPCAMRKRPPLQQLKWLDLNSYLPDDILTKVDRAAMAVSLETRIPMLDHRFVRFALSLPLDLQLNGRIGKQVLRQVLYRHVPRKLVDRPKQGFAVPLAQWLRHELRDWGESLLDARKLEQQGYWNVPLVRAFWTDHVSGRADFSFQLWGVLMFQAWLEIFETDDSLRTQA